MSYIPCFKDGLSLCVIIEIIVASKCWFKTVVMYGQKKSYDEILGLVKVVFSLGKIISSSSNNESGS